jgi:uncharacterized integral membrane protein
MRLLRRSLWVIAIAALLYVGWRFPMENAEGVSISYLFGSFEAVPVWVALLAAFGAGAALATVAGSLRVAKLGLATRRYRKAVNDLESEVHQLRNLPLSADGGLPAGGAGPIELESDLELERGS